MTHLRGDGCETGRTPGGLDSLSTGILYSPVQSTPKISFCLQGSCTRLSNPRQRFLCVYRDLVLACPIHAKDFCVSTGILYSPVQSTPKISVCLQGSCTRLSNPRQRFLCVYRDLVLACRLSDPRGRFLCVFQYSSYLSYSGSRACLRAPSSGPAISAK
ncbi:hypothetical protein RRG08_024588 [Elysia crispata]|uniref:Uncharacterized protein n=1 Tax=Elysia crispata TaxID=231223 RepID=A0AAE0ZXJ4_9GAST|nr:hypothetical protein RRG08_024588 [Elysia crispata]